MCQLHLISSDKDLGKKAIHELNEMLWQGNDYNKDGWGVTDGVEIIKDGDKYALADKKQFENKLKGTFFLGHNRATTSGKPCKPNSHPFESEHFIFAHNGIIDNYAALEEKYKVKCAVDSQMIGVLLEKYYKKGLIKAIKSALNQLGGGLSVFIIHKPDKKVFYVKHSASFLFARIESVSRKMLVGSTDSRNLTCVFRDTEKILINGLKRRRYVVTAELEPEEDIVYEIDGVKLVKRGKIKPKETSHVQVFRYYPYREENMCYSDEEDVSILAEELSDIFRDDIFFVKNGAYSWRMTAPTWMLDELKEKAIDCAALTLYEISRIRDYYIGTIDDGDTWERWE